MDTAQPLIMLTNREGFKYLFGKVPEGTQRVINENRAKVAKLRSIFFTGIVSEWSNTGGLPGLFLTISDSTKKSIEVFSASSLFTYVVATWRSFVFRKGVELKINQLQENKVVSDSQINVHPIIVSPLHPPRESLPVLKKITSLMFPMDTTKVNSEDPESYKIDHTVDDLHNHAQLPVPDASGEPATSYKITFVPVRGKFDPKAAIKLGIKPGIDFRKLSEGESVPNDKGEFVHPHQVLGATKTFPDLVIIDIPHLSYMQDTFTKVLNKDINNTGLVYHFLSDDIDFMSSEYQNFIGSFPANCTHVVSCKNSGKNNLVFKSSAINTLKLRALQSDFFNLPCCDQIGDNTFNVSPAVPLTSLQKFTITSEGVIEDKNEIIDKSWDQLYDEHVEPLKLKSVQKEKVINSTPIDLYSPQLPLKDQVQTITLGTGSAMPSLYRNVISNLVRIPFNGEFRSILFDGGENTLGTMKRTFGSKLEIILQELSVIYLSHLHADHHLGLVSVMNEWFKVNSHDPTRKLYLVLPWQYNRFLQEWSKMESTIDFDRIVYISCEDFLAIENGLPEYADCAIEDFEAVFDGKKTVKDVLVSNTKPLKPKAINSIKRLYNDLNIESIYTCRAIHCFWSYSVTIKAKISQQETFTVSYSGDTRPNAKFIEIGKGSDLLIHESSLSEDLIEEAIAKKHSTMIEAVTSCKLMNCPKIILTHFSTRFSNKADFSVEPDQLIQTAVNLRNYLTTNGIPDSANILKLDQELNGVQQDGNLKFNDIQICYAFDSMIIRYGDIVNSKLKYNEMLQMFLMDEMASEKVVSEEKRNKEMEKVVEKRNAKRDKRMKLGS